MWNAPLQQVVPHGSQRGGGVLAGWQGQSLFECLEFSFSFRVRVAWSSRPPCSIVAGYSCSHPFMVFNRVVSLLAVDLVVVGSLENNWLVGVFRLSCVWIEVHSSSTCCWGSSFSGVEWG